MTEHYFSKEPSSELKIKKIRQRICGRDFEFFTSTGIFSKDQIDKGTLVLAESMQVVENDSLLDVGCGMGVLGIVAAVIYNAKATLTDINKRAIMLAKKNLELNKVKANVVQGSLYEKITGNFDVVVSNPPQNAGKEVCFNLIERSTSVLNENGTLQVVARPNKGGKTLSKKMNQTFGNVQEVARKSGYCVYMSVKSR